MDMSLREPSLSSSTQSIAGDRESRNSEMSMGSLSSNIRRLFDFTQDKIPGLYRLNSKYFILEFCEIDAIAYAKFHTSSYQFQATFREENLVIFGIQYCGLIEINHGNSNSIKILVPGYRSYDPAGNSIRQYINSRQFINLLKLLSIQIRAAQLGVRQKRLEKIKHSIESISQIPDTMFSLWNWTYLQVILACYKRLQPPKYHEYILNKVLTEEFSLDGRDNCKEYLEKCLNGGEVKPPRSYYKSILANERKLPFDVRVQYTEFENRESKEEKATRVFLHYLPKIVPGITIVREGKSFVKMVSDCERLCKLYDNNVAQNKCKVM